jgi:hypothetical protein
MDDFHNSRRLRDRFELIFHVSNQLDWNGAIRYQAVELTEIRIHGRPYPLNRVRDNEMVDAGRKTGCRVPDPDSNDLSFLAFPVIPELKLIDKGLFDVTAFTHVPLFAARTEELYIAALPGCAVISAGTNICWWEDLLSRIESRQNTKEAGRAARVKPLKFKTPLLNRVVGNNISKCQSRNRQIGAGSRRAEKFFQRHMVDILRRIGLGLIHAGPLCSMDGDRLSAWCDPGK